ncbi:hypothetical protein [Marininema halotolerans]|uniref:Uncharacterized protein n=1 Tax=Marininema halotolerans TaxID=1155944 RepID=A0A1I6TA28_9BACL|nr:hypothetical protein [Marininema halotolerans]SFS86064.1 hypothetical protein SAMN05444972_109119 [Marininema halotolerans]
MDECLFQFLEENYPEDDDASSVWMYITLLVKYEGYEIRDLVSAYHEFVETKKCGTQGVEYISNWSGTMKGGIGIDKETCNEALLLSHWKKVMDEYSEKYGEE